MEKNNIQPNEPQKSETQKIAKKKKKQMEDELLTHKIKQLADKMNNILSNTNQENNQICTESESDTMFRRNIILNERLVVIDMMLKLYPQFEKDRKQIIEQILCNPQQETESYVLDKINLNNKIYYKDRKGCLIDQNLNVTGMFVVDSYFIPENKINIIVNKAHEMICKLDNYFTST